MGDEATGFDRGVMGYRRDRSGTVWRMTATGRGHGGRCEVTDLRLESGGLGRLTATLLSQLESQLSDVRQALDAGTSLPPAASPSMFGTDEELAGAWGRPTAAPAELPAASRGKRRGPVRDDTVWRRRAETMAAAWRERQPMIQALRDLEPGASESTYRKRIDRAREWDRDTGAGILADVGRVQGSPFLVKAYPDPSPEEINDEWLDPATGEPRS
ncbi:hypothetical protein [Streptomyces sp. NP160]|uniref:hypothetical protein n=1 Tax=Streptomyces sp. NP160 TaxID=2586637 RepID=UPI0015D65F68|nr:hypothetical protein [Streptomyces sp. NP160]